LPIFTELPRVVDTREDGSQEARSPGPRVEEGRTAASLGRAVESGLDHIQDMLRAGLIHRVAEKAHILGNRASAKCYSRKLRGIKLIVSLGVSI